MSDDQVISVEVAETGESAFAVEIKVSGHVLKGDEPPSNGGADLGPAPFDYLSAALAECTAMTVRWYARQKNWPLVKVSVFLTHRKSEASALVESQGQTGKVDLYEKFVTIEGPDLSEEQRKRLLDVAAKCPVQRALETRPVIRTLMA